MTTRRYTEKQVTSFEESPDHYTLQVSVQDRFGDNGIIGVVICNVRPGEWEIDTWLLSCRVLKRKVEEAICNRIVEDARRGGARKVIGTFIPTERNGIARDLFARLGFEASGEDGGAAKWVLDVEGFTPFDVPLAERREPAVDPSAPA